MIRLSSPLNRISIIDILENKHQLTRVITENLCRYMENVRQYRDGNRRIFSLPE